MQSGIIISSFKTDTPFPNYVKFKHDSETLSRYEDEKGRYFSISGITIFDRETNHPVKLSINIGFGILLGYSTDVKTFTSPAMETINIEYFKVEYHDENSANEVRSLLGEEYSKYINPSEVYEVFIKGEKYFHLKEIGDGDFIGVNRDGILYNVSHDPISITEVEEGLKALL